MYHGSIVHEVEDIVSGSVQFFPLTALSTYSHSGPSMEVYITLSQVAKGVVQHDGRGGRHRHRYRPTAPGYNHNGLGLQHGYLTKLFSGSKFCIWGWIRPHFWPFL